MLFQENNKLKVPNFLIKETLHWPFFEPVKKAVLLAGKYQHVI